MASKLVKRMLKGYERDKAKELARKMAEEKAAQESKDGV